MCFISTNQLQVVILIDNNIRSGMTISNYAVPSKTCMQFWIKYVYQISKKSHTWHHGLKAFFTLSLAFLYIIPLSTKMQRRAGPSDLDIFGFGHNGGPVFQNSANVWKLDPWPLNWPNARIRSMHQGGGEGWRGWSNGGFNTNLLSNFGRFVPQPLATQRKLIRRDVNAISRCRDLAWGAILLCYTSTTPVWGLSFLTGQQQPHYTYTGLIRASSAVKMVTTLPDESPKR